MELIADNLACRRAGRLVFAGVGFAIASGEAALLRGPNGSGKSSLLRIVAGLLPAETGDVLLDGVSLRADRGAFQEFLAFAGHLDAIKPQLTVLENLHLWARLYGADTAMPPQGESETDETDQPVPRRAGLMLDDEPEIPADPPADRLEAALDRLGLRKLAHFPAGYCSAGQKRRLGLARLLIVDRPVWLLDEPTVSLDRETVARFAATVTEHLARGGLAVIATHIDLGLPDARVLDVAPYRPDTNAPAGQASPDAFAEDDGSAYL